MFITAILYTAASIIIYLGVPPLRPETSNHFYMQRERVVEEVVTILSVRITKQTLKCMVGNCVRNSPEFELGLDTFPISVILL